MTAAGPYRAGAPLFLWWVADPAQPVLIGELELVRSLQGVSLRYVDAWCEHGLAVSEDLPLLPGHEFLPSKRERAAGAVASVGVTSNEIEMLAEHIDRPFLREQREEYAP